MQDVNTDLQIKMPRVSIEVDRDKAAALQLNVAQIQRTLYDAFGPQWSSTIYSPTNQYKVLLEMLPKYQRFTDYMSRIYFKIHGRSLDSAGCGGQDADGCQPADRQSLRPIAVGHHLVQFEAGHFAGRGGGRNPGFGHGEPAGDDHTGFQGTAKVFQESLKNLTLLLIIAIAVVYIILGVLYESYVHPMTILSGPAIGGLRRLADVDICSRWS